MLDPEQTWTDKFKALPPVKVAAEGAKNTAQATDALTTGKAELSGITGGPVQFTFMPAIFAQQLLSLPPSKDPVSATMAIAAAWAAAIQVSVVTVPPGASVGAPSPATTFSVVPAPALLLPPMLQLAQQSLAADLLAATAKPAQKPDDVVLGKALRKATTLLAYMVTGLNSIPTPAGPLPLVVPSAPVM